MADQKLKKQLNKERHLQYALFMNENGDIFSGDESGELFLQSIDLSSFYSHLQCIQLNSANTASTVIIDNTSYSLRLIPVDTLDKHENHLILNQMEKGYIILLQNQSILSSVIHTLNKTNFKQEYFNGILDSFDNGIFITKADGTADYINTTYEDITGISREAILGKSVYDMESKGLFRPLVTPIILKSMKDYTVFQAFKTGKYAIISGMPVYDTIGKAKLILICANALTNPHLLQISKQLFSGFDKSEKDIYHHAQIDVIAESRTMRKVLQNAVKIAHYDVPVLLLGDSGTGKEVLSTIIHTSSERRFHSFVKVNCSAISQSLLEAELFGYESGAFTGASTKGKPGLFEVAQDGTILLDEIGDMPIDSQVKLLRVVQSGEIYRVGGLTPIKVNARIIAATNRNLRQMIKEGTFRNDLYQRLNVISLTLPPLAERKQDIRPLILHYCYIFNNKYGTNKSFSPELLEILENYPWPGNVRELCNLVERMTILCIDDELYPEHFYTTYSPGEEGDQDDPFAGEDLHIRGIPKLSEALDRVEEIIVTRAMDKTRNTRKAASLLGISQSSIMRKIKKYGIRDDGIV